jgi:hypothetical protein
MKKILYQCLFIFWIFSSCQKEVQLTGHWVSKEYFQGKPFTTIDFYTEKDYDFSTGKEKDSLMYYIKINKNSLAYSEEGTTNLVEGAKRNQFEFAAREYYNCLIEFRDDSLYLSSEHLEEAFFNGVFTKYKESESFYQELFIGVELKIDLPQCTENETHRQKSSYELNLNIGFPKHVPDSVYIQGDAVFLGAKDVPKFIQEFQLLVPSDSELELHLNTDRKVPDSFLNKVISIVRKEYPNLKIYKASFHYNTKKLCYTLIQN